MRSKWIVPLALLAGLALLPAARAEQLRWKFKPGETLNYVLERGAEGKISLSGAEIVFTLQMIFDTSWKPKSVAADGTAEVDLTIDRIQLGMASPLFGKMNYDSKSGEKPEQGPAWSQLEPIVTGLLGQTIVTKISASGEVKEIEFPEKLKETFAKQQVGENRRQGFGIGGNAFNEKGLRELVAKSVMPLPEKGEAESWTQSFDNVIPRMGKQTAETTFKVAGSETVDGKKLAKISAATELTFEPEDAPQAELEITQQESDATYYFDPQAGHMVKSSGKQSLSLEISGPQELTQQMKETTSMRLGKSPDKKPEAPKEESKKDAK